MILAASGVEPEKNGKEPFVIPVSLCCCGKPATIHSEIHRPENADFKAVRKPFFLLFVL